MQPVDWTQYIGCKFNKLTILGIAKNGDYNRSRYICKCDCGKEAINYCTVIVRGVVKSCGCYRKENRIIKHGKSKTKLYQVWNGIIARCENPHSNRYEYYGGRGIKICKEWRSDFVTFHDWSMANGYKEGLSIDRINLNGDYEPNNCRWATNKMQANNTSRNRYIEYNDEIKTVKEWSEFFGFNYKYFHEKLKKCDWDLGKLLEIDYFKEKLKCV